MLYAATTFWLMVVVLSAWGVHTLWSGLVKPRAVNLVLLPGTLVAQMGHVLGLLITGATVSNVSLLSDDESAAPEQDTNVKPRIPFIGPVIIGMLPLIMCALAIFAVAVLLGGSLLENLSTGEVRKSLPLSLAAFWDLLRHLITMMEDTLDAALRSDLRDWRAWLFIYLLICLTVRMAPFPGNLRGSLIAILVLGLLTAIVGLLIQPTQGVIEKGWSILSLSVVTLLLLLLFSAVVRGVVSLARLLFKNA